MRPVGSTPFNDRVMIGAAEGSGSPAVLFAGAFGWLRGIAAGVKILVIDGVCGSADIQTYAITEAANPSDGGSVSCDPNPVNHGSDSTCSATPSTECSFASWAEACAGQSGTTCTLSSVTAAVTAAGFSLNTFSIGGTVSGLASAESVVLQNNGGDDLTRTGGDPFTFATEVDSGGSYAVTVKTQPTWQTCTVANGTGTNVMTTVTDVTVTCVNRPSEVGSTIKAENALLVTGNTASVVVTVRDDAGNPLPETRVTLIVDSASVDAGAVSIRTSPSETDTNGEALFLVSSSVEQSMRLRASFNPDLFIATRWADNVAGIPTIGPYGLALLSVLLISIGGWMVASAPQEPRVDFRHQWTGGCPAANLYVTR